VTSFDNAACAVASYGRGMHVIVVGGGVSGLGSALVLARQGHDVTVVERDDTPMPSSADDAFEWDRRGAPQVRHSHAFLARLVGLLRRDYADIYASLLAEGATEMRFGDDLPDTITNFEREAADDELVMLACRRTTFEWVLRRAALAEGRVTFRTGVGVDGLLTEPGSSTDAPVPHVTGVHLADGSTITADLTVVAAGRRSALSDWLLAAGAAPVAEEVDDTGIVYFSRFYRLPRRRVPAAHRPHRGRPRLPQVRRVRRRQPAPSASRWPRPPTTRNCARSSPTRSCSTRPPANWWPPRRGWTDAPSR
jgi:voltage-gated potassium channel Kch